MDRNNTQTGHVDVEDLNNAAKETLIHIELTKTVYGLSSAELHIIEQGASSIWKDISLSGFGIGIPCLANALIENQKETVLNGEIFWNSLIGGIAIVIAVIFSIFWGKSTNSCKVLIQEIKNRPKYKMQ